MATASLNPFCSARHDNGLTQSGILPPKTVLADQKLESACLVAASRWRCDSVCMERTPVCDSSPQSLSWFTWLHLNLETIPDCSLDCSYSQQPHIASTRKHRKNVASIELLDLAQHTCDPPVDPPPPYTCTLADAPPSYDTLHLFPPSPTIQVPNIRQTPHYSECQWRAELQTPVPPIYPMTPVELDYHDTSTFRQVKGKSKRAQKQAEEAKWADEGSEGANEGGEGGGKAGGGGGGGGGGSNNGDGGAGDDGGGWDGWNTGGGKRGKKGKKAKKAIEEEEEEKKEKEEEKKVQEGNSGGGANDLSWMDDKPAVVDWEGFTATEKKGKKNKKPKAEVAPEPTHNAFEDINLGGETPKLDLDFENNAAAKGTGTGFSFGVGGFGSNWDTGNTWGFSGLGNGVTATTDSNRDALGTVDDNGSRGFGKKGEKTTTTSGFDFGDFATLNGGGEAQANTGGDEDDWATGFTASSKKNSKTNKKGAIQDLSNVTDTTAIGTAVTDPTTADDSWGAWGTPTSEKDKSKKKKNEPESTDVPSVPLPPQPTSGEPPADDVRSSFESKAKKKNKKVAAGEPASVDEPNVVVTVAEPETDFGGGSFGSKKEKKKGKKDKVDDKKVELEPVGTLGDFEPADPHADNQFDWAFSNKKDKEKKKGKKGAEEDKTQEPTVLEVPEKDADLGLGWSGFGTSKDKKKGKKDTAKEGKAKEPAAPVVPNPEPEEDAGFDGLGSMKEREKSSKSLSSPETADEFEPYDDDIAAIGTDTDPVFDTGWGAIGSKKGKKTTKTGDTEDWGEDSHVIGVTDPLVQDSFDVGWGTTATKKGRKHKKGGVTEVKDEAMSVVGSVAATEAATKVGDDDWTIFGGDKKKDKKGKKPTADAKKEEALPPPSPPPVPEESPSTDVWGTAKKEKKGKKSKTVEAAPPIVGVPDFSAAPTEDAAEDEWGTLGLPAKKDKRGKKGKAGESEPANFEVPGFPAAPAASVAPTEEAGEDEWGNFGFSAKEEKKGKKGKPVEPEPGSFQVLDFQAAPKEEAAENGWGTFGLSARDRKKKEKEKEKEDKAMKEQEELMKNEMEEVERREKEELEKEKEKSKPGKKGKTSTIITSSRTKDLLAGSVPDSFPAVADDFSTNVWGSTKKDSKKKSGKKDSAMDVPPPVPTPPAQGFTPPPGALLDDLMDDEWGDFDMTKDKTKDVKKASKAEEPSWGKHTGKDEIDDEKAKVESAAKPAKSFWGGMSAPKTKTSKDKESEKGKKEADVEAVLDPDEMVNTMEEEAPPKKGSKSKAAESKFAKMSSKEEKANKSSALDKKAEADAEIDALIDFDELDAKDSKSNTADATKGKGDDSKADVWSFWGSSKKPAGNSGKKGDEPRKEINKADATNHMDPLAFVSNEPEASPVADERAQSQPAKTSKSAMSASKTSAKASVAQKIKALEEEKKKALEPLAIAPPPEPQVEAPAKKTSAASKSVTPSKLASASKKKNPSPPAEEDEKKSKDSVPGGFPDDEENLIDMLASSPAEKKSTQKRAKPAKPTRKDSAMDVDVPVVPEVPAAPPTPPAEPVAPKSAKKERARVVRDQGASSWGFWGAAPKKDEKKAAKAKDDAEVPSTKKTATPAFVRSKSTKTAKEKDKDTEKSSSSDVKEKKADSRPPKSRGSSLAFFAAAPPARTRPSRRVSTSAASKTTSKRQSMDIDAFGLPSPPPEDAPAGTGKAAKLMGTTAGKLDRKASAKGKQKAAVVPDPYPIDDDDMVMVNGVEDPVIIAPVPQTSKSRDKSSKSKSTKQSKPAGDAGDDIVMVDGPSQEEPEMLAFDEQPKDPAPLKRSTTSAKKAQSGKFAGLFGGFGKSRRNSETLDRPRAKAVVTDDEGFSPRKRTVHGREDSSKRIRRDDRRVRRPEKPSHDAEVFITDALNDGAAATELDDAEVRRQERRAKRDGRDSEDRRARRAEKEADDSHKAKTSERRSRREEDAPPKESTKHSSSRPHKSDRRRSYLEASSANDRPRAHRSRTEQTSKKRHSVAAGGIIDDYFDTRNAPADSSKNEPYMHGANDHTSSWVKSQISDPADPPPQEGTVIEPAPELGGKGGYAKGDEDARRAARKARRQSRYGPEDDAEDTDRERRHRRKEKGSEGSAAEWGGREREKLSRRYTDMGGVRGAAGDGGRPSLGAGGKRGSWLKKVTGLGM
ncbi:MAG: hypothetical protein Q9173_003540 [Seirophora scorigena]